MFAIFFLMQGALGSPGDVAAPLECGVASAVFGQSPETAATAVNTGKLGN